MAIQESFIQDVVEGVSFQGLRNHIHERFSVDSRVIEEGDTFVALPGSRVDGHDYILDALEKGASAVILSTERKSLLDTLPKGFFKTCSFIIVPDVYKELYALACQWRKMLQIPIIGITGSLGKTSTKELLGHVMRSNGAVCYASKGNQNTLLGVALNILHIRTTHTVAIIEMGVNVRGEMDKIANLVRPTTGIITLIGHSHLEGLGSVQDIAGEKRAIFSYFKEDNVGIINGDQALLAQISYPHPTIKFGFKTTNQVQARKVRINGSQTHFTLKLYGSRYQVTLPTGHSGRILNVLACSAVAHFLGVPHEVIIKAIQEPFYVPGRYEEISCANGPLLINDCYNASPESMKEALFAFDRLDVSGEKVAVLGDMYELGANASFWHRQLGRVLRKTMSITKLVLVGKYMQVIQTTPKALPVHMKVTCVKNWEEAYAAVHKYQVAGNAILIKASRGMQLDRLVESLQTETL